MMNNNRRLEFEMTKFIQSNIPLIFLQKFSLDEVEKTMRSFKTKSQIEHVFSFNITQGFSEHPGVELSDYDVLLGALTELLKTDKGQIVVIHGAESLFNGNRTDESDKLSEILSVFVHRVQTNKYYNTTIIFNGSHYDIPPQLRDGAMIIENPLPDENDIYDIIKKFISTNNLEAYTDTGNMDPNLIENLKGLSYYEITQALSFIFYEFGIKVFNSKIDSSISREIYTIKEQMLKKMGTLSIVETTENVDDIIGLEHLKAYIEEERAAFSNMNLLTTNGVELPKGILILGEPGTGKSMTAKAAANALGLKLIKFDISKIMGKYVGDSEKNIMETLKIIEHMSPCVLWIDEIEKAFSGVNDSDNQVLRRVFGILLSWMSDDNKGAFVVGTANNVDGVLPPEFLRKGRFDEIFYVSKPGKEARLLLFQDKLNKRAIPLKLHDDELDQLARESAGFTGADIEYICNRTARKFHLSKTEIGTNRYSETIRALLLTEVQFVRDNREAELTAETYNELDAYYKEIYGEELKYLSNNEQSKDALENKISAVLESKISEKIDQDIEKMLNKKRNRSKYRNADG